MDPHIKRNFKRLAQEAETGLTRSLLKWKYKKEGRGVPGPEDLEARSRKIADEAHNIISERGKRAWNEVKKVYEKGRVSGEEPEK